MRAFRQAPYHFLSAFAVDCSPTNVSDLCRLLESTDKLLSDIAVETGFWDQSHLTRIFKRERGTTPGEYRTRHRYLKCAQQTSPVHRERARAGDVR